jgi:predicted ATPase/class 3 adenylate cyclase
MDFDDLLNQVLELLRRDQRVSYRALKRRFGLDDDYLEDVKDELIYAKKLAADEDSRVLVWVGDIDVIETTTLPTTEPERTPSSYTPTYLAEKILTGKTSLEGERKVVTVLFADIKDSTELIRDLDPEDAQKLLDPAIHIMMDSVHRFEGTVNQVLGDGIMSIFGAPIAHEDHAARACYAALALQSAMKDYTDEVRRIHGIPLQIRVGLNSGEVVVRTISSDLHMDYSAVGSATHLAARMEQLATPGSIVLSGSTLRLVEGLVRVDGLGPIPVKGMDEPVEVYELTGASAVRRRLQAAVTRGLTKFVGRETEIDALNQALEQAGSGHGQLIAAVGEAGVGKSRLVYEFVHSHRTQGWLVLECASVSYGKATPYFPVIDLLKRYTHVDDGDDPRTIRAKVTGQILTLDELLQETIPALLSLLDALPEDSPFLKLDPPQRRQRTLDGLKRILLRESLVQPLVLVCEDLHWHDNESQALLDSLVESLPTAQLSLLVNYRPEYTHNWGSKTYYTELQLGPLPPESADALLEALLGDDTSLEPLKKLLIERTEGNPFFLEESVRTLVETQVLAGEPGTYRMAQELPAIQVPATVQAVLAARIDRLPQDEKGLLQTASVIGTEVPFPLLQAMAEMPEDILYRGLTHLQATEFLYEMSLFPERVYTFKHALTHEVTYRSLLHERRRVLHAHIVETLETLNNNRLDDQIERLAYHAFRGEIWEKALTYFQQAGTRAMAHSAYTEAIGYFEQALAAVAQLPECRDILEQALDLRFDLRNALHPLGEDKRISDNLRTAEAIAEKLGDSQRLGQIALYLCIYFSVTDEDRAIVEGQRALNLGVSIHAIDLQVVALIYLGMVYSYKGDYRQALDFSRQAMALLTNERLAESMGQAYLPALLSRSQTAMMLAELGDFTDGRGLVEDALRLAKIVDQPYQITSTRRYVGLVYRRQGEFRKAIPVLEQCLALAQSTNITRHFPLIASALGGAYAFVGRVADALPLLDQVLEHVATRSRVTFHALMLTELSEACILVGRMDEAQALAERLLELSRSHTGQGNQAHALRLLGDIAVYRDPPEFQQAATHYQQALTLANELGMRPLKAHCHRGLGTLYSQTGQIEQARAELSTAIEMYRDMAMNFWLPETEAALAAVGGR